MKVQVIFWTIIVLAVLALAVGLGWYGRTWYLTFQPSKISLVRENDTSYHFINPLLSVEGEKESPEYLPLKKTLSNYIANATKNKVADSVSVYLRDPNNDKWTGVNEDELYDPSSMLKVAVMLGYLKESVDDPKVLTEQVKYESKGTPGQHYPPAHPLATGYYTVRELIEAMIVNSDNDALASLYNHDRPAFVDVFKDLSIAPPESIDTTDFMSPKIYSRIFRVLYNSTYLPRDISEEALKLLSYTSFNKGLVAGVPADTVISHKFGEHTVVDSLGNVQEEELHDCGIIYYPQKPYFLCVMTKGKDFSKLETVISDISKIVYSNM